MTSDGFSSESGAQDPRRITRRLEVRVPAGRALDNVAGQLAALAGQQGVDVVVRDRREPVRRLDLDLVGRMMDVASVVEEAEGRLGAEIMRDEVLPAPGAPADPPYPDPESARRIAAPGSSGEPEAPVEPVIVAIIDSGIMARHPILLGHLWTDPDPANPYMHGFNVIGRGGIEDEDGHGTMLAGTVLAGANSSHAVRLMAVKFFDPRTIPESGRAAEAIDWAVKHGAHILNLSWAVGIDKPVHRDGGWKPAVREAIARAGERDVLVVVAAGNSGANNDTYRTIPASYGRAPEHGGLPNVITVMATDDLDDKPGFSNYGAESVHLAAPGMRVFSTHTFLSAASEVADHEKYQRYDGTSASAAYVAGAAALLKSKNRKLSPEDIKALLIETVDRRPYLPCVARGRLNLSRALAKV